MVFVFRFLVYTVILLCVLLGVAKVVVFVSTNSKIVNIDESPQMRVAIVFGAGLRWDGTPTAILKDRVKTAVDLYQSRKIEKILMSGDNRTAGYNEPAAMSSSALD